MHKLQSRWVIETNHLYYYGMRSKPYFLKNKVRISSKIINLLNKLPKKLDAKEHKILSKLIQKRIVVEQNDFRKTPETLEEATFCKSCVANDFIIPGLEFNKDGICPMCETKEETKTFKSILPVLNVIPKSKQSKYDVAVFYSGGKDSSFLIYYLAKVLNLRVLALTWLIPYMSDSALKSIENAKEKLKNVTFVSKKVEDSDLRKIYRRLYDLERNNCACPSLAYIMFYPLMVEENVPYFVLGNEPVQMLNLYYNHLAPKIAFNQRSHKILNGFINVLRILTFRKPLRLGQFHTLSTMRQLAHGDSYIKKIAGYNNSLVTHVIESIREAQHLLLPLKKAIKYSSRTGRIPAFVHIDFNDVHNGNYEWTSVKEILKDEIGWESPISESKGLHTSCNIETCKENSQFLNFYHKKTRIIPFSAVEISLASRNKNITKEQGIEELKTHMGFQLAEVNSCKLIKEYMRKKTSE